MRDVGGVPLRETSRLVHVMVLCTVTRGTLGLIKARFTCLRDHTLLCALRHPYGLFTAVTGVCILLPRNLKGSLEEMQ